MWDGAGGFGLVARGGSGFLWVASKRVLIRAIGPTFGVFGVTGVLADPRLDLHRGETRIGENDNWGGTEALRTAFSSVGAFALENAARDAALVVSLDPGSYTLRVNNFTKTFQVS